MTKDKKFTSANSETVDYIKKLLEGLSSLILFLILLDSLSFWVKQRQVAHC